MKTWSEYLYNRLPKVYRENDGGEVLKRFIEVLGEAGFDSQMNEIQGLNDLFDTERCPTELLPLLCATLGIKYEKDIPDKFQRKMVKNLVNLYKIKGTKTSLIYLAREMSGLTTDIVVSDSDPKEYLVRLNAFDENDVGTLIAQEVIQRYVQQFTPVGITATVVISAGMLDTKDLTGTDVDTLLTLFDRLYDQRSRNVVELESTLITESGVETRDTPSYVSSLSNKYLLNGSLITNVFSGIDVINGTTVAYN